MIRRRAIHGAADDEANVGVRQEEVVVDEAPPFRRCVDDAQAELLERGFFRRPDPRRAAGEPAGDRERPIVAGRDDRVLALSHVRGEKHYCTYHGIKFGCNSPAFEGGHGDFGIFGVERRQIA